MWLNILIAYLIQVDEFNRAWFRTKDVFRQYVMFRYRKQSAFISRSDVLASSYLILVTIVNVSYLYGLKKTIFSVPANSEIWWEEQNQKWMQLRPSSERMKSKPTAKTLQKEAALNDATTMKGKLSKLSGVFSKIMRIKIHFLQK